MDELLEFQLAYPSICAYTVPLLNVTRDNNGLFNYTIGTGVLVKVADKLLVASAAHCIRPPAVVMHEQEGRLLPRDAATFVGSNASGVRILNRLFHPSLDIGLLELAEDDAVKALGKSCCSLGQAHPQPLLPGIYHVRGYLYFE